MLNLALSKTFTEQLLLCIFDKFIFKVGGKTNSEKYFFTYSINKNIYIPVPSMTSLIRQIFKEKVDQKFTINRYGMK